MGHRWTNPQVEALLDAKSYRQLFRIAIEILSESGKKISYAEIARRGEFAARSFPRDVLLGVRGLSSTSGRQLAKALGLPADVSKYLLALVELEKSRAGDLELPRKARVLRDRAIRRLKRPPRAQEEIFSQEYMSEVYASLGGPTGATLDQIRSRSGLDAGTVRQVLHFLESEGAVERLGAEKWKVSQNILLFERLSSMGYFPNLYRRRLSEAARMSSDWKRSDALFWESTFSVDGNRMPELKEKLRELMSQFIEISERSEGDQIASVALAMIPLKARCAEPGGARKKNEIGVVP